MTKPVFVCLLCFALAIQAFATAEHVNKHTVKKGETLSSISREYGVKVKDLIKANPVLSSNATIKPGQQLNIPGKAVLHAHADVSYQVSAKPKATVAVPSTPDTPYKDEDNKARTAVAVSDDNPTAAINNATPVVAANPPASYSVKPNSSNGADYASVFSQYAAHGYKVSTTRGAANFLEDNTSGNPYLALYNNAETGSVIKVTNMMNKKTVYVKVVGHVPANDASREVILKLSNTVARQLGTLDSKFLVEVAGVQAN